MTPAPKRDLPASVKARLLNLARGRAEQLQGILVRYAIERLLYRLSRSPYADGFILKGAILASAWGGGVFRPTKDLDLLGQDERSPEALADVFRLIARADVEADGLAFDPHSVTGRSILEKMDHPGVRIPLEAFLGKARIPLQVDVGFGDPVTPAPLRLAYPCLLEYPEPVLLTYPPETVIAEKYDALVRLGLQTGRFKDLFDLWHLGKHFPFDGAILREAIQATFRSRRTPLPAQCPMALSDGFAADCIVSARVRQIGAPS